jgi:two-component sensor histidine kinase
MLRRVARLFAVWTVPGLMYTFETAYAWGQDGRDASLARAALYQIPGWWVWALATLPIVALARRFPPTRVRSLPVHVGAWVAVATAYAVVKAVLAIPALPGGAPGGVLDRIANQLALWLPASALAYAAVVGIAAAIEHARTARERGVRQAELAAELTRAQLEALRAQIHPHFVFNTLHTVAAIVRAREPEAAVAVIASLAEILRDTFRGDPDRVVVVREELAWIARYLAIQQARFADKVEVHWAIGDGTLDALVPQMVLQPLVENAFRHGIEQRAGGRIELAIERDDEVLTLSVRDDGPARGQPSEPTPQVGLASTRARLALIYADAAQLSVERVADQTIARVRLPFRTAAA